NLGRRLGLEGGFLAPFAEYRGVVAIGLAADPSVAGEHEINLASGCRHPGLRRKTQKARLATSLGEDAHQLFADAGNSLDRHPVEMIGAHHDGLMVARRRISHRPVVHVLPYRLIAVDVAFAVLALVAAKDALLERAVLLEFGRAGLHLLLGHVAIAARAAELQHQRQRAHARALWSIGSAFRKVSDDARRHLSIAIEVELALELIAELIEIVLVARRKEIVGRADHLQDEITGRPGLARCHRAIAEHALPVLVDADLLLDLISVHDFHGVPPVCLLQRRAATLRVAESLMYKAFGHNDPCDQRRRNGGTPAAGRRCAICSLANCPMPKSRPRRQSRARLPASSSRRWRRPRTTSAS